MQRGVPQSAAGYGQVTRSRRSRRSGVTARNHSTRLRCHFRGGSSGSSGACHWRDVHGSGQDQNQRVKSANKSGGQWCRVGMRAVKCVCCASGRTLGRQRSALCRRSIGVVRDRLNMPEVLAGARYAMYIPRVSPAGAGGGSRPSFGGRLAFFRGNPR